MEFLTEDSYIEFKKRYKKNKVFAIISTYYGKLSKNTNITNNSLLRKTLRNIGYDMVVVKGHFREDETNCEAMIVFKDNISDNKSFVSTLLFFAKKYHQNMFIFVDENNNVWKIPSRTDSTVGGIGYKLIVDVFLYPQIENILKLFYDRTYTTDKIKIVTT